MSNRIISYSISLSKLWFSNIWFGHFQYVAHYISYIVEQSLFSIKISIFLWINFILSPDCGALFSEISLAQNVTNHFGSSWSFQFLLYFLWCHVFQDIDHHSSVVVCLLYGFDFKVFYHLHCLSAKSRETSLPFCLTYICDKRNKDTDAFLCGKINN